MAFLDGKEVLLGVTGGIAAYKSALLARELMKAGATVSTVLTESAREFITPLTFESLTGQPCRVDADMFAGLKSKNHIGVARDKDLAVIAPATATTLARLATGSADNMLSATILAAVCPVVVSPAMHTQMWLSVPVQRNVEILKQDPRYIIVPPGDGELASGDRGPGRLPSIERIMQYCIAAMTPKTLKGRTVVVTGGPTREHIDPIRVITNPSSGRMGMALAEAAGRRGASVRLILGPCDIAPDLEGPGAGWTVERVETTLDMLEAVKRACIGADALVMAAAPADERPSRSSETKIGKEGFGRAIEIEPNPDILLTLAPALTGMAVMAFAAESLVGVEGAVAKMKRKHADLLFANPAGNGRGFGNIPDEGILVRASGESKNFSSMSKELLADLLIDELVPVIDSKRRMTGV